MSEQPPAADWYPDPEDADQYRYWDGEQWTQHRAPRYTDGKNLRSAGKVLADMFNMITQRIREFAILGGLAALGSLISYIIMVSGINALVGGELGEIMDRISSPGFDPESPDQRAYFESLDLSLDAGVIIPLLLGLALFWLATLALGIAMTRVALAAHEGHQIGVAAALRNLWPRLLRFAGVYLQIVLLVLAAMVTTGMLVILLVAIIGTISGLLAAVVSVLVGLIAVGLIVAAVPVIEMALVTAQVGPRGRALRRAIDLTRGSWWAALGRIVLLYVVVIAAGLSFSLLPLISPWEMAGVSLLGIALTSLIGAIQGVMSVAGIVIIYRDLGGEVDFEDEVGLESST